MNKISKSKSLQFINIPVSSGLIPNYDINIRLTKVTAYAG